MPGHPDRLRWNARYAGSVPTFTPHPLVARALAAGLPDGPVLELACGRSGSALELAAAGRRVVAVDVSDVALGQLAAEAHRRGLAAVITCVQADAGECRPQPGGYALVLATRFWDEHVFDAGARAVSPGGLLAWEALAQGEDPRPYHVPHGELAHRLPPGYTVVAEDLAVAGARRTTWLLARAPAP
ncbi:methyltransferase domain-containing protein [Prauserella oleivorans]|uniref:Methyltransferase domain-containing protein n=1 Tax=Prauserella oleivorans TaxID=1478153 RepID=A0ABW5W5I3_9PSEU